MWKSWVILGKLHNLPETPEGETVVPTTEEQTSKGQGTTHGTQ